MDDNPIPARSLEKDYHIDGDNFERAYKNHLSGFSTWEESSHALDWLIAPWNIGSRLSIDETCLSTGEVYTILSNKDAHGKKGCIVAIVKGTKAKEVIAALKRMPPEERLKVTEITLDFSDSMKRISTECFPNAMLVLDRFHHQQFCIEAVQELRIQCRREVMTEVANQREEFRLWKKSQAGNKEMFDKDGNPLRSNAAFHPERMANGETKAEILMRSKGLLAMSPEKWGEEQRARAKTLFELFPQIETAYSLTHSLRIIFSQRCSKEEGRDMLVKWYAKVGEFGNAAFNNIAAAMYDREDDILNYFVNRSTNASAESLNSKIKLFRAQLHGVVDTKFFLFRLMRIFA